MENARFSAHWPDINPFIRVKLTNMWLLLNNSREFAVLKKVKRGVNAINQSILTTVGLLLTLMKVNSHNVMMLLL